MRIFDFQNLDFLFKKSLKLILILGIFLFLTTNTVSADETDIKRMELRNQLVEIQADIKDLEQKVTETKSQQRTLANQTRILSNDILRKVSRETEIDGFSPMQVFLGLYFDFQNWRNVPLI